MTLIVLLVMLTGVKNTVSIIPITRIDIIEFANTGGLCGIVNQIKINNGTRYQLN
jgi:hypothetical protein